VPPELTRVTAVAPWQPGLSVNDIPDNSVPDLNAMVSVRPPTVTCTSPQLEAARRFRHIRCTATAEGEIMPLTEPAERELLHLRDIAVRGYRRADGLFDIEAEIADTKSYGFSVGGRRLEPGDRLHNMLVRLTVDENLMIVGAEASTEAGPFLTCAGGTEKFGRLVGLSIKSGFLREANARIGGVDGCTHIRELLQQMATVAFQTSFVLPSRQGNSAAAANRLVNSCHAYSAAGPVVQRRWPELYTGSEGEAAATG
jgi:hypothetical protein